MRTITKTKKCELCGRRFVKKPWHKGSEKKWCFTCCVSAKFLLNHGDRFGLENKIETVKEISQAFTTYKKSQRI